MYSNKYDNVKKHDEINSNKNSNSFSSSKKNVLNRAVSKKTGKYGFMDMGKNIVIPLKYDYVNPFIDGLSCVKLRNKYGFIDETGKEVIPIEYDFVEPFKDGVAHVKLCGKWIKIDKTGKNITDIFNNKITKLLSKRFENGFKFDSTIELERFRDFFVEEFGEKIELTDEELKRNIAACCSVDFKGKGFVISEITKERIKNEVNSAFANGVEIIFYESFYEKHEEWLNPPVVSAEILKQILAYQLYPKYRHKKNYFIKGTSDDTEVTKIENEIFRVWGDETLLSYTELKKRLPYIPIDKIKCVMRKSENFIKNNNETYTNIKKIEITDEEYEKIIDFVTKACKTDDYVSIKDIPLGEIVERNHELTRSAIRNGIFSICLSDKFEKRGKIIIQKGGKLDISALIKDYCKHVERCTLDDLLKQEKELTGENHRKIAIEVGYSVLVRINKNNFVAEKYVDFDIDGIDNAIEMFVTGEYLPLKSFTTFASFPHCGKAWNLFLLESYCRRFSKRFRFDALAVNSRNVGVVIRKSCNLKYMDIMVEVVTNSNINLNENIVTNFLYENGYVSRKGKGCKTKVAEIISKVKTLRNKRVD